MLSLWTWTASSRSIKSSILPEDTILLTRIWADSLTGILKETRWKSCSSENLKVFISSVQSASTSKSNKETKYWSESVAVTCSSKTSSSSTHPERLRRLPGRMWLVASRTKRWCRRWRMTRQSDLLRLRQYVVSSGLSRLCPHTPHHIQQKDLRGLQFHESESWSLKRKART